MTQRRSRFDAELAASLSVIGGVFPPTITPSLIDFMRVSYASEPLAETLSGRRVEHSEYQVPGHLGEAITVSVFRRSGDTGRRPTIVYAHSGGLMFGDRFSALGLNLDWVEKIGAILICPEYRLAPEFQDPYAREDMYAALLWTAENADDLGVDRARLIVAGASSGGDWPPEWRWRPATGTDRSSRANCSSTRCSTTEASHRQPISSTASASGIG